jgi:protein-tyrosine-phosphatase
MKTLRRPAGALSRLTLVLSCAAAPTGGYAQSQKPEVSGVVVFVCEHGNVKSLIAREWFNRLAARRGLRLRAESRGVTPEASVPPTIADALRSDGFDVSGFEPRAFSASDATRAVRLVGIGVDLSAAAGRGQASLDTWQGIPPASESYSASRDALRTRIEALLEMLGRGERP